MGRSGMDRTDDFQKLCGSGLDRIQLLRIRIGLRLKNFAVRLSLPLTSDVPESFLSSQSHKPFESESSQSHYNFFQVESWLTRVRIESQELSSHFESLVCMLESMSSHIKFQFFSDILMPWNGAQRAIKWCPISKTMLPNMLWSGTR